MKEDDGEREVDHGDPKTPGNDWSLRDPLVQPKLDGARLAPVQLSSQIDEKPDSDLVAPIIDLSVIKVVTTVDLFSTSKGTELIGEMIELDHVKVINGDDVNLPKFLQPDQYKT